MAILSVGLLGSSRNKVGNIVTYRMKGQDIARAKATQVSNPRTAAQQAQRVKLANLVAMYRANLSWMDNLAFSTKPQKWSDYNAFVSANIGENRVYLTKAQAAAGFGIVAPYVVSRGSLPSVEFNATTANVWQSNIAVGSDLTIGDNTTIGDLSEAILANNNGLAQGMQLSLIMDYQQQSGGAYFPVVRYYEVILDPNNNEFLSARMDIAHLSVSGGNLAFTRGTNDPIIGFTFVLSHTVANTTRVSTQRLVLTSTEVYDLFTSDAAKAAAIESYGAALENPFLVSDYGQGSSNAGVAMRPDIVSAAINDRAASRVGDALGSINTEEAFTLTLNLSQAPEEAPLSCTFYTYGESANTATSTSIRVEGNAVVVSFPAEVVNPSYDIRSILLTLADGVIIDAQFEQTSGDITE